ncbi:putative uncharacterized protein DDB_G0282133 [Piliocolobus tephrosceles]|uniref:putative uncharacterized protein DDB_G0282133 n=1 Tax=Piliocolobus tephrosceles TaxID=591936 RepID=UPI000C2A9A52|nr:putative uncharacterized protein DDB_G0282133 [Piliocolobus tephrosceles]
MGSNNSGTKKNLTNYPPYNVQHAQLNATSLTYKKLCFLWLFFFLLLNSIIPFESQNDNKNGRIISELDKNDNKQEVVTELNNTDLNKVDDVSENHDKKDSNNGSKNNELIVPVQDEVLSDNIYTEPKENENSDINLNDNVNSASSFSEMHQQILQDIKEKCPGNENKPSNNKNTHMHKQLHDQNNNRIAHNIEKKTHQTLNTGNVNKNESNIRGEKNSDDTTQHVNKNIQSKNIKTNVNNSKNNSNTMPSKSSQSMQHTINAQENINDENMINTTQKETQVDANELYADDMTYEESVRHNIRYIIQYVNTPGLKDDVLRQWLQYVLSLQYFNEFYENNEKYNTGEYYTTEQYQTYDGINNMYPYQGVYTTDQPYEQNIYEKPSTDMTYNTGNKQKRLNAQDSNLGYTNYPNNYPSTRLQNIGDINTGYQNINNNMNQAFGNRGEDQQHNRQDEYINMQQDPNSSYRGPYTAKQNTQYIQQTYGYPNYSKYSAHDDSYKYTPSPKDGMNQYYDFKTYYSPNTSYDSTAYYDTDTVYDDENNYAYDVNHDINNDYAYNVNNESSENYTTHDNDTTHSNYDQQYQYNTSNDDSDVNTNIHQNYRSLGGKHKLYHRKHSSYNESNKINREDVRQHKRTLRGQNVAASEYGDTTRAYKYSNYNTPNQRTKQELYMNAPTKATPLNDDYYNDHDFFVENNSKSAQKTKSRNIPDHQKKGSMFSDYNPIEHNVKYESSHSKKATQYDEKSKHVANKLEYFDKIIDILPSNLNKEDMQYLWGKFMNVEKMKFKKIESYVIGYIKYLAKKFLIPSNEQSRQIEIISQYAAEELTTQENNDNLDFQSYIRQGNDSKADFLQFLVTKSKAWDNLRHMMQNWWMEELTIRMQQQ